MNMEQRREKIVSLINREGSVSFTKLKENFHQVSEMTLRRDLAMINFHTAFIGVTGYIHSRGFTCGSPEECELKRTVIEHSEKAVMLMDSQKIGVTSMCTFARAEDVSAVVSDGGLDEKTLREFERAGAEVL